MPRESQIKDRTIAALKRRGVMVRKRHGSAFSVAGDPDLYGCAPAACPHCGAQVDGHHFEIELKRPGQQPTRLQEQRLAEWRAAGAAAGSATSPEEALQIIEALCISHKV